MAGLTLKSAACVRSASKFSECNLCETLCGVDAIKIVPEALPAINLNTCMGCGGCVGVCPTQAFELDNFCATDFFFEFVNETDTLIACQKNVPCLSVLNVEYLIALALLKKELVLDIGHCEQCSIKEPCLAQIEKNCDEANYLLDAMNQEVTIEMQMRSYVDETIPPQERSRRDFFETFTLSNALKAKKGFEREVEIAMDEFKEHVIADVNISALREKKLIDKRKLHMMALKRVEKPEKYHVIDATELSFTSQKILDEESCTACQMCYRICPTGALSSDMKNSKIDFDPFMCMKCHLCHDVCEPDALTLSPSYNIKEFFEPHVQRLISFDVKLCDECGLPFTSLQGEKICRRCQLEEDEAKELWGIE
jgi:formate hydrogenlyase subunit 6/NADH:ubiquinone oxidoreductase subunit I